MAEFIWFVFFLFSLQFLNVIFYVAVCVWIYTYKPTYDGWNEMRARLLLLGYFWDCVFKRNNFWMG